MQLLIHIYSFSSMDELEREINWLLDGQRSQTAHLWLLPDFVGTTCITTPRYQIYLRLKGTERAVPTVHYSQSWRLQSRISGWMNAAQCGALLVLQCPCSRIYRLLASQSVPWQLEKLLNGFKKPDMDYTTLSWKQWRVQPNAGIPKEQADVI